SPWPEGRRSTIVTAAEVRRTAAKPLLPIALSLAVLGLTTWFVDLGELVAALAQLDPAWVLASLAFQGLQVLVLAARWHWINARLQLALPFSKALAEYT